MSSVSLYCSEFTNENEVVSKLSSKLSLEVITDADLIGLASKKYSVAPNKMEHCMYKETSVFNKFTLERERCVSYFKAILAESLTKNNCLYYGFISFVIPSEITHVLKVLVSDNKKYRTKIASLEGFSEKEAGKLIKISDQRIISWADFLCGKNAFDHSIHDIVIPASQIKENGGFELIDTHFKSDNVLETDHSTQAVRDLQITGNVEYALLENGHKVDVSVEKGHVLLQVNTSTFHFSKLTNRLTSIANAVNGVTGVEVRMGEGCRTSIYRDQKFELPPKVLLVDDEIDFVQTLSERLKIRNFGSHAVYDGQQALDFIQEDDPDVMVIDLRMPGINGIDVLRQVKQTNPHIEVIILSGHGSLEDEQACMELGAFSFLHKPADLEKLSETIKAAYAKIDDNK
jgi:two-component system, OmpR family, response regulator CpxR